MGALCCVSHSAFGLDVQRYDLLEELERSYRHIRRDSFVKPNMELLLARELFELSSPEDGLLPESVRTFIAEEKLDEAFVKKIESANLQLQDLSPEDRKFIVDSFHRQMVDDLLEKLHQRKRVLFSLRDKITYDSNVAQTPEALVNISNKDGTNNSASLSMKFEGRDQPYGELSLDLSHKMSEYLDTRFRSRDSKTLSLSLNDKLNLKKGGINYLQLGVDLRGDWLRSTGNYDYTFTTLTPKVDLMLIPKKEWGRLSDMFITFFSAAFERHTYTPTYRKDQNGFNKDSNTPSLTMIFMNFKTWTSHASRTTLSLITRNQNSKSDDFTFNYSRVGLAYTLTFPKWSLTPELAVAFRDQEKFLNSKRHDISFEPGINFICQLYKDIADLNAGFKFVDQDSNQQNFEFESSQYSLGINIKF